MNKTEILVFILFGTAYEIKTVTCKQRYNISMSDFPVLKSSEQVITGEVEPRHEEVLYFQLY